MAQRESRRARNIRSLGGIQYLGERRKTARATVKPTSNQLHWAAGLIEGEGSFKGRYSPNTHPGKVQVTVFQLDREPLEKLLALFGGSINRSTGGLIWTVSGTRGLGVALTLYPLMSQRRRAQVRAAL